MADHYLKTSTYVYRITYHQEGSNYIVDNVHVAGSGTLPDGNALTVVDQLTTSGNVLVDQVLTRTSAAAVVDYRTAAKAQIDSSW
jgi:hypothetical protein